MWSIALVCAALALPAQADPPAEGEGEGEGEGEIDPCAPACLDTATLQFCDDGVTVELACADVDDGAVCASRTDIGADCLLPAGAVCDPAYAFGASRCVSGHACLGGVCAPGSPSTPATPRPTSGTTPDTTSTTSTDPLSSFGCASTSAASTSLLAAFALLLRRRRRVVSCLRGRDVRA